MANKLLGAVAIEDEEISFALSPYDSRLNQIPKIIVPDKSVPKPMTGHDKNFIEKTIQSFFKDTRGEFAAIGISMFGMIDTINCALLDIPGRDWSPAEFNSWKESTMNLSFKALFSGERWADTSISVRNDATATALGESSEHEEGSPKEGRQNQGNVFAYVRVGSGINAGVLRNGRPLRNRFQPEVGHIRPMRHFDDVYPGCCDFHQNCFEGLASLRAIIGRTGYQLNDLDRRPEHSVWHIQAYYLAQIGVVLNMTVAPNCIVFGGSAVRDHIFSHIRDYFGQLVGSYPRYKENENLYSYIRPAKINNYPSLRGALLLARLTAEEKENGLVSSSERIGC